MVKLWKVCTIALGASGMIIPPSLAQDSEGNGVEMTFGVGQRFERDSNLTLIPGGEKATTLSVTNLSFGFLSETKVDTLSFGVSTALRAVNGPDTSGTDTSFDDLNAQLSFARDVEHSALSVSTRYNSANIKFIQPLVGIIDEDGDIVFPDDLDALEGTGTRVSYGLNTSLVLKRGMRDLAFRAGISGLKYDTATAANLFDNKRSYLGVTAGFIISPVLDGSLSYDNSIYSASNTTQTDRTTNSVSAGLAYAMSKTVSLRGSLGYSNTETDEGIGPARATTTQEGYTTGVGLNVERPNGAININLETGIDQNGRRNSFDIGRTLSFPQGNLGFSIGLTEDDQNNVNTTTSANWSQELPSGNLTVRLQRGIIVNNDDENRLISFVSANYSHPINSLSSLNFNGSYSGSQDTGGGNSVKQANLSTSYSHAVTQDWNLNTGYTYRMRNTTTTSSADSHAIFLSVGRSFSISP